MASIFWYSQAVIMIDYLEQGRTINSAYYAGASQVALTAATECGFEIFTHPSLSPDMAPSDF